MLLDDIGFMLEASNIGTVGTDIFLSTMPTFPDTCIAVIETPGLPPERTMGNNGTPLLERAGFQVICRGPRDDYQSIRETANVVFRLLGAALEQTVNGTRYLSIEAISSVFDAGGDENERPNIVCNYLALKEVHAP